MKTSDPRKLALDVLLRVDGGAFSDLALDAALEQARGLDPRDRALVTELVYGILRRRGRLDFVLERFSSQPLAKLEKKVLWLLRLGAYQMLELDRVPDRAAVHATVELARGEGLERVTGFINGILRALGRERERIVWPDAAGDPEGHLIHALSLPGWMARLWIREMGVDEALALAAAMAAPPPFTLRANTLRVEREDLLIRLRSAGYGAEPTTYAPEGFALSGRGEEGIPGDREGFWQVQDEASILIAHLLEAHPGDSVLDACAAPGGKTTHLAALTRNGADILALDLHPHRVALVAAGARRLGCERITTRPWDLTAPPDFLAPESFDRILVDAPCSGLGVLRRNPETRWRRGESDISSLAALQLTILDNVAPLLRPGGMLLYSVCTFTREETDGVVGEFLSHHPEFARDDLRRSFPPAWQALFDERGAFCTFPHRHGGMDAFFAARFRKG